MKIGVGLIAQNYTDWERFLGAEAYPSMPATEPKIPDAQVYTEHLRLGRLVEPLGFDSIWSVEHHFTPYTMINNPAQFLAYFAGCTERIELGTFVMVLPWHDPIRAAEEMITLDHMLAGRKVKLGFGRGLGRREFDGFRVPMDETRQRFKESLDIIRLAIANEWFSYDGEFFKIPRTSLRPMPRDREALLDQMYMAWGSPQSLPIAADEGLRPLFIPQKPWPAYRKEVARFNQLRVEQGREPLQSTTVVWLYCAPTDDEAEAKATKWMNEYAYSSQLHYELTGDHLRETKGYEHYAQQAELMKSRVGGADGSVQDLVPQGVGDVGLVYGSPETCIRKIGMLNEMLAPEEIFFVFQFGSMTFDEAEASMRLLASEALPALQALEVQPPVVDVPVGA